MSYTRILDLRPPAGIVDRLCRLVGDTTRSLPAADEQHLHGPIVDPADAAGSFVGDETQYRSDRLDVVCVRHVVGERVVTPSDKIAAVGAEIRKRRGDGTLGLLVVTEDPSDLDVQPYDFGIHVAPVAADVAPTLVTTLDELGERIRRLTGLYALFEKRVRPTNDATGFEIGADLSGRRFEPRSVGAERDGIEKSVVLGPGQFTRAAVDDLGGSCLECPTSTLDDVLVFGFRPTA